MHLPVGLFQKLREPSLPSFVQKPARVDMYALLFQGKRWAVLLRAALLIAAIALVDWRVIGEVALGFLYLLPMIMIGSVANRLTIGGAAALCTFLAERFGDLPWNARMGTSRVLLHFAAFVGAGLFVREVNNSRKAAADSLHQIELERDARRDAEEQLEILIESSPVAIITADAAGTVLMANGAAHRMLGVPQGGLPGRQIHKYLPALTNITSEDASMQLIRAVMQARGLREDGEAFLADICFSTYQTSAGTRLAAMVLDISEDIRAHEVSGLQQLLEGSRIAVSALSHEIRNVCGAIAVVHRNLKRAPSLAGDKDFEALGSLVDALEKVASVNVQQSASQATEVDLNVLLDELKIVVAPALNENGIQAQWIVEPGLPAVWADRSSLMQVFLNLISNSVRALSRKARRVLTIAARVEESNLVVEVTDNAGGVAHPEHLFRPFQSGAESTGLGLYLSRAFMRSFGGELRYHAIEGGACFIVELLRVQEAAKESLWMRSAS
jgi:two-component system, LuxR family, sensor kinase FixL